MTQPIPMDKNKCWQPTLLFFGLVFVTIAYLLLTPWNIRLVSRPQPASTYEDALQSIERLRRPEPPEMNPDCRLQLLTHGDKVERAIVLVHGYTECPYQFRVLGQRFYALGDNVLIAPLPHHGLADRLTDKQVLLTAEELAAYADAAVDIAQGLGEQVTMMGLSGGGVVTAWAAQNRSDLDIAVLISPGFGFKQVPTPLTAAAMNAYTFLPNRYTWWNSEMQAAGSPPQQYPRYATRALVQFIRLGYAVQAQARWSPPAARKIVVLLNGNDYLVNNEMALEMAKIWQARGATVIIEEFDAGLKLPHDLVDLNPDQPVEMVHSRLIELGSR